MNFKNNKNLFYIHIGMDKTGTTYIQDTLNINSDWLNNHGFSYLDFDKQNLQHSSISRAAVELGDMTGWQQVKQYFENINNIPIISFEGLYHLERSHWESIQQLLYPRQLHLIFYLRNQSDMLASGIAQRIKTWDVKVDYMQMTEEEFIVRSHNRNFIMLVDRLSIFPQNSIHLRLYEKSSFYCGNLLMDFFLNLGIDLNKESVNLMNLPEKNSNPTLNIEAIAILYELKQRNIDDSHFIKIRNHLLNIGENDAYTFITQQTLNAIQKISEKPNAQLAKQWFNRDALFLDQPKYRWRPLNLERLAEYYKAIEAYIKLP